MEISKEFEVKIEKLPEQDEESTILGKIGNTEWNFFQYNHNECLTVGVECNKSIYSNLWNCDATIKISLWSSTGKEPLRSIEKRHTFKDLDKKKIKILKIFYKFEELLKKTEENRANLMFKISIVVHSTIGITEKDDSEEQFDMPNEPVTDVVLLVEGKKVYYTKQILAMHSKYFHKKFFANAREANKKEFKLDAEVKHSEFLDLLRQLLPSSQYLRDDNLPHILKLAARFEMWKVISKVERYLIEIVNIESQTTSLFDMLKYAGDYKMDDLQERLIKELDKETILELKKHERFNELSLEIVDFLFDRLTEELAEERLIELWSN